MFESYKAKRLVGSLGAEPAAASVDQLRTLGEPGVDALLAGLQHSSETVRQGAARVLGELGPLRAIQPLAASPLPQAASALTAIAARSVRPRVLRAVRGGEEGAAALVALLTAADEALRGEAEAALVRRGSQAAPALLAAFETEELSEPAARVLKKMGADGTAILVGLVRHQRNQVRRQAAAALESCGWQPAEANEQAALAAARQDWQRCRALGPAAVEPLLALLGDGDSEVRRQAARVLGALKDPRAVSALLPLLADRKDTVRLAAIESLGEIGDRRAVEKLAGCLRSRYDLRTPVLQALQKIGWKPEAVADRVLLAVLSGIPPDAAGRQLLIETVCEQNYSSLPEDVVVRGLALLGNAGPELLRVLKRGGQPAAVARGILNEQRNPEERYVLCSGCFSFLGIAKDLRNASRCPHCGARIVL